MLGRTEQYKYTNGSPLVNAAGSWRLVKHLTILSVKLLSLGLALFGFVSLKNRLVLSKSELLEIVSIWSANKPLDWDWRPEEFWNRFLFDRRPPAYIGLYNGIARAEGEWCEVC